LRDVRAHRIDARGHRCMLEVQYLVRDSATDEWVPYCEGGKDHYQWEPLDCFLFEDGAVNDLVLDYLGPIWSSLLSSQRRGLRELGIRF
jgi:hypothetical protein